MMSNLVIFPILLPLLGGILTLFARQGGLNLQRLTNLVFTSCLLGLSTYIVYFTLAQPQQVYLLGNWLAPYGIVLVLDMLSAMMILLTAILALFSLVYAIFQDTDKLGQHFHVLFQIQLFGLCGAFLTGDLFNLFVFFEVLLLASYGLLLHGGGRLRTKGGLHYVVINLVGSSLFLFAVGTLYGVVGTLNIADLAVKISQASPADEGIIAAAGLLLLVVFGIKSAMFPLYLWLPGAYAQTSAAVAALFAIMTKVGLYAIIRVHGTLFSDQAGALAGLHSNVVLWLGIITLLLATFGVYASRGLKEQAAFLILASVATLLVGIGINTEQALSATLFYLIHSTLIGAAMFLLADIIAQSRGAFEDKFRMGPAIHHAKLIGSLFIIAAIAIVGMPPLSGFMGKVLLLQSALASNASMWIYAAILSGSLIMIMAMARSGSNLFYNVDTQIQVHTAAVKKRSIYWVFLLLMSSPILVISAGPISSFTDKMSAQLSQHQHYIDSVLTQPAFAEDN